MEPIKSTVKLKAVEDFEGGFDDWIAHGWGVLRYDSNIAKIMGVGPPPKEQTTNMVNQVI